MFYVAYSDVIIYEKQKTCFNTRFQVKKSFKYACNFIFSAKC